MCEQSEISVHVGILNTFIMFDKNNQLLKIHWMILAIKYT